LRRQCFTFRHWSSPSPGRAVALRDGFEWFDLCFLTFVPDPLSLFGLLLVVAFFVGQLDLEKERAARLPRSINAQNRVKLLACLRAGPRGPVVVVPKTFDEEAEAYANQILQVLRDAQFEIRPLTGQRPLGFGSAGAFMFVSDMSHPPPHAGHVQGCFRQIGVELAGYGNPKDVTDSTVVVIAVSSKP
jgi:hypothetical protein